MTKYDEHYSDYLKNPDQYWLNQSIASAWIKSPSIGYSDGAWFPDGVANACHACVDVHIEAGFGDQIALIYDSPVSGNKSKLSYRELGHRVEAFSRGLKKLGIGYGSRVLIYMPMIPEAIVAMLATARLGAIHSVVFGGFASAELAKRIDDFKPDVIVTASCGIEPSRLVLYQPLLEDALDLADHDVESIVVAQRPQCEFTLKQGRDYDFEDVCVKGDHIPCYPCRSTDPLYVLYTSGTTGVPKGVVRDIGGYLTALKWSMSHIYDAEAGDTFWAASDIGWVVGHSYIVYGPLAQRCTTVLYEGKPVGTPDAGAMWRVIEEYGVAVAFAAPTAIRAIKREDSRARLLKNEQIKTLRSFFLAGERADPDTVSWAAEKLNVPVIDHWWQTELGWPAIASYPGLQDVQTKIGSAGRPVPGFKFEIVNEHGEIAAPTQTGSIVIKSPLPPGSMTGFWNSPDRFEKECLARYPGYYETGDAGFIDEDGFIHVMGRTDDIINTAGHRLSTGAIEEVVCAHPQVAEAAVVGAADPMKGEVPVAFVVMNADVEADSDVVEQDLISRVRGTIGPVASFKSAFIVAQLPKTRSGKILRKTLREIVNGEQVETPATIEDAGVINALSERVRKAEFSQ